MTELDIDRLDDIELICYGLAISGIFLFILIKGNAGRGDRGACGGERQRDGSGNGRGNRNSSDQPKKRSK